jgi:hypothetical protein
VQVEKRPPGRFAERDKTNEVSSFGEVDHAFERHGGFGARRGGA